MCVCVCEASRYFLSKLPPVFVCVVELGALAANLLTHNQKTNTAGGGRVNLRRANNHLHVLAVCKQRARGAETPDERVSAQRYNVYNSTKHTTHHAAAEPFCC